MLLWTPLPDRYLTRYFTTQHLFGNYLQEIGSHFWGR
jgi:hypothetical protein